MNLFKFESPYWHDLGRIFGGIALTVASAFILPFAWCWLPASILGLLVESYWTVKHQGITLDCIFDFFLMQYSLGLVLSGLGNFVAAIIVLGFCFFITGLLWSHRIPRPHKADEVLLAEYLWQWGVDRAT